MRHVAGLTIIFAWLAGPALADIVLPGSNHGTDGVFAPTASIQIDLGKAQSGPGITWESPGGDMDGDGIGDGVYDRTKWAVVFKFSSVNIPSGVTVTFENHPSCAPVVWLVQGDVTIAGTVTLDGKQEAGFLLSEPGPGGFRGGGAGRAGSSHNSGGFGPGGPPVPPGQSHYGRPGAYGSVGESGTSYPGIPYGNAGVLPLIGGSGGRGITNWGDKGGGAGGGAILIASSQTISVSGVIRAVGGNAGQYSGGGSGGAIRLVCNNLAGATSGRLYAYAGSSGSGVGSGGDGRIRVESNDVSLQHLGVPAYALGYPGEVARIWPESTAPSVRPVSLGGQSIPVDPRSRMEFPHQDVTLNSAASMTLVIAAENVPLDWDVKVRVVPRNGANLDMTYSATHVSGDQFSSTWEAQIPGLPDGFSAMQVRASKP